MLISTFNHLLSVLTNDFTFIYFIFSNRFRFLFIYFFSFLLLHFLSLLLHLLLPAVCFLFFFTVYCFYNLNTDVIGRWLWDSLIVIDLFLSFILFVCGKAFPQSCFENLGVQSDVYIISSSSGHYLLFTLAVIEAMNLFFSALFSFSLISVSGNGSTSSGGFSASAVCHFNSDRWYCCWFWNYGGNFFFLFSFARRSFIWRSKNNQLKCNFNWRVDLCNLK